MANKVNKHFVFSVLDSDTERACIVALLGAPVIGKSHTIRNVTTGLGTLYALHTSTPSNNNRILTLLGLST